MNLKLKGEYAVSLCATYFLANEYQVLMPYGDRGHYDLVLEKDGTFQRVQCKWTENVKKPYGYPQVSLRLNNGLKYHKGDFDLLWVATPNTCYLIPFDDILREKDTKDDIKLYPKWDKYRIGIPIPVPSEEDCLVRRSSPRLTNDDKATILRLIKEGKTEQSIADVLGVTRACISMFLSRNRKNK